MAGVSFVANPATPFPKRVVRLHAPDNPSPGPRIKGGSAKSGFKHTAENLTEAMNHNRKLLITALAAAVGTSLLTVAALSSDWNVPRKLYSTVRNVGTSVSQKLTEPFPGWLGVKESSPARPSIILDDKGDHYEVSLNLPEKGTGQVKVKLTGSALRIEAPGADTTFHQTLVLNEADPTAAPGIERDVNGGPVRVTVPKVSRETGLTASAGPWPLLWDRNDIWPNMSSDWDSLFDMPSLMPRMGGDPWRILHENLPKPSFRLREEKDNYVAELHLPGCDMKNVNAEVNDRTLTVEARARKEETQHGRKQSSSAMRYSRRLTLPGPVNSAGMKLEPKDDKLTITLPKAAESH